jgi:RHS repeat-associated protein/uncharacterized repeat protein (TIGR01451 family)
VATTTQLGRVGSATLDAQSVSFDHLTTLNDTSLYAQNGAVLTVPLVNSVTRTLSSDVTWQANGAGSQIVLPAVTNLVGFANGGVWYLQAYNGGHLALNGVQTLTNGFFNVLADGAGSVVDLSQVTEFDRATDPTGRTDQTLITEASNGGAIYLSALDSLNNVGATLRGPTSTLLVPHANYIGSFGMLATDGAVLSFPGITQVTRTESLDVVWQAEGAGSRIAFPNLTNVAGFTDGGWWRFHAYGGGQVNLGAVRNLTNGWFEITADGTNSVADFSGLTSYEQGSRVDQYMTLEARNGGTVLVPQLTSLNHIAVTLRNRSSSISLSQITNADNSALLATDGAVLALPGVAQVARTNNFDEIWEAGGAGSRVVLTNLTTITGFVDGGWWRFHASTGGQVELEALQDLTNGWFEVTADGTNSVINLPDLTSYAQGSRPDQYMTVEARTGGAVMVPKLTSLNHIAVTLRNPSSSISLAQVRTADNSALLATDGAVLALPGVLQVARTNSFDETWAADGAGSRVVLPNLTTINGFTDAGWWRFHVSNGGRVELAAVHDLTNGWFDVTADGANSAVALPGLRGYEQGSRPDQYMTLTASNGGTLQVPQLTSLNHIAVTSRNPSSSISLSQIQNADNSALLATDGAVLALPGIVQVARTNNFDEIWEADGPGSRLVLPNLTAINGFADGGWWRFHTSGGGRVEFTAVHDLTNGWFEITANGTNSVVDLPGLTGYEQGSRIDQYMTVEALNGGAVLVPQLTSLNHIGVTLRNPSSSISLAQIRNADNSALLATDGAVLALPGVVQVARTNNFDETWEADGAGSRVVLPNLTAVIGFTDGGWWRFHAFTGGHVELPAVQTFMNGWFEATADGANSVVDLSGLTRFQMSRSDQYWGLEARNGGSILIKMTDLDHVALTIRGAGFIPTAQIRSITQGTVTMDGAQVRFPSLTVTTGTQFVFLNGGAVQRETPRTLPLVINQVANSSLTTAFASDLWQFSAQAGESLRLHLVNSSNPVFFTLMGPNNWLGFSSLTNDSELLTLPVSGNYLVQAAANGIPADYAFEMVETAQTYLALGTVYAGQFVGSGQAQLFRLSLTNANPLLVLLRNSGSGNRTELYVKHGEPPTRGDFDYRFSGDPGSSQQVVVPAAAAGTWFVLAYADTISTPGSYTVAASSSGVILSDVAPKIQAANVPLILSVDGAGFDSSLSLQLLGTNNQSYVPAQLEVDTFTHLTATIPASTLPVGTYSVQLSKQGTPSAQFTNVLNILSNGAAQIETKLDLPSFLGFHIPMTLYVDYTNSGTVAMPAPLLVLRAAQNGREGAWLTLDPKRLISGYWTPSQPAGYSHSVQFLAMGSTPGLLQPGESGRVPVYYAGIEPPWQHVTVEWTVTPITADSSIPLDLTSLRDQMRSPSMSADAWNALWPGLAQSIGTNWGQYVQTLDDNSSYLARLGERVSDASQLLLFEMQQANRLNPLGDLATTVEAKLDAPGIALTFSRSFPGSISGRFRQGTLGRGWSHNWEFSVSTATDGTVTLAGPGDSRRVFQPDSRYVGVFFSQPGDFATLTQLGDHLELVEPDGLRRVFLPNGQLSFVADPNGNRIVAAYSGGLLATLTHSSGQQFSFGYNNAGLLTSLVGSRLSVPLWTNTFAYDSTGQHLSSVVGYDGRTESYSYNLDATSPALHALASIDTCCNHRLLTYDQRGRLAGASLEGGAEALALAYGPFGKVTVTDALGNPQTTWFDHRGLVVKTMNALGNPTLFTFDDSKQLIQITDAAGLPTHYSYDGHGNQLTAVDALGDINHFTFAGPFDRLTDLADANSNATHYRYDANANLQAAVRADNTLASWRYDSVGNVVTWTNRRSQVLTYQYDSLGNLTNKTHADGSQDSYLFDQRGNLVKAASADNSGTELYSLGYEYDSGDRLTKILFPNSRSLAFTCDAAGRRKSSVDQAGHLLNYSYDAAGRLESLTNELNQEAVRYFYDVAGRLQQKQAAHNVFTSYGYDAAGQLLSLTNKDAASNVLSYFNCTYDNRGRRVAMQAPYGSWSYSYDAIGQLIHAVLVSSDPHVPSQDLAYTYDAMGNRIFALENGVQTDYQFNSLNQYLQAGSTRLGFDLDGNLTNLVTSSGATQYLFDDENRLIGFRQGMNATDYLYDPLGNRVRTLENGAGTDFVIDPIGFGNLVGEYSAAGGTVRYDYGLELLNRTDVSTGQIDAYAFDEDGNTAELASAAGVLDRYAYAPFSGLNPIADTIPNRFRGAGAWGVSEESSGLVDMRARFYDPAIGRFISEDPAGLGGGEVNFYSYVGNRVPGATDPSGTSPWDSGESYGPPMGPTPPHGLNPAAPHSPSPKPPPPQPPHNHPPTSPPGDDPPAPPPTPTPPPGGGGGGASDPRTPNDPNSKTGPAGFGLAGFIPGNLAMPYRIDFENQSNASAPAQQVFIDDQLSANVDWSSLRFTEVGFGDTFLPIDNLAHFQTNVMMSYLGSNFTVQIEAGLKLDSGGVYAVFRTVDPTTSLPPPVEIGFLPPEDGTGRGQGHLSYVVNARSGLPTGAQIRNVAVISFDNLTSLATNLKDVHNPSAGTDPAKECLNTIDAVPPTSSVLPLDKVMLQAQFPVTWSGQDDPGGSGIASFDISLSDNGGAWQLWLAGTTDTTALYQGSGGHTYAFLSRARDQAGNLELVHALPDAVTTVAVRPLEISTALSSTNLDLQSAFSYTITITNQGSSSASGIVLTNTLPSGLEVNSVTVSGGAYNLQAGLLFWNLGTLPQGGSARMTVTVTPTRGGTLTNSIALGDASGADNFTLALPIRVTDSHPALSISISPGQVLLSWPAAADGFELMVSADLSSSLNWIPVGGVPAVTGEVQSLAVPLTEASQYYQLRKRSP